MATSPPALPKLPAPVVRYVAQAFARANRHICMRIARVPNSPEESLDQALITFLAEYSAPRVVMPGWAVRIDTHFLGGMRHFGSWEIADIGLLLFARQHGKTVAQKTALLQSKRLYPTKGAVADETPEDYRIGFGKLLPSKTPISLSLRHAFDFTKASAYKALKVGDDQWEAISKYEEENQLAVYYLLYNPWSLDASYTYPASADPIPLGMLCNAGCRVLPAAVLRAGLKGKRPNYMPAFTDIESAMASVTKGSAGWTLEHFVAYELLKCRQGNLFESLTDENIFRLFNRRSGPIASAVSVTIEQFAD